MGPLCCCRFFRPSMTAAVVYMALLYLIFELIFVHLLLRTGITTPREIRTRYSTVSFVILKPGEVPNIRTVTRYLGQEIGESKVPTIVNYDHSGNLLSAGAELPPEGPISDNGDGGDTGDQDPIVPWKCEQFINYLHPHADWAHEDIIKPPLPPSKNVVSVYSDFYAYLFNCTREFIRAGHGDFGCLLWQSSLANNVQFVITHPNDWDSAQHSIMRQSAAAAGLIPSTPEGFERIEFVSEDEASFNSFMSDGSLRDGIETGNNIMVIDAGRYTIDFRLYTLTSINPIEIEEKDSPSAILHGSNFVTRRAYKFLKDKLATSRFGENTYLKIMAERFDQTTKKRFNGSGDSTIKFSGFCGDNDKKVGIRFGNIRLSAADIATFFDPAVVAIVDSVKSYHKSLNSAAPVCLLVGGFAANEYLYTKVSEHLAKSGIKLFRPNFHSNEAVAEGALSFIIDHFVTSRAAKLTYGVKCVRVYDSANPDHASRKPKVFTAPDGTLMLGNGFQAILRKGTRVTEDTTFIHESNIISRYGVNTFNCELVCYRGNSKFSRWMDEEPEHFSVLCNLTADASEVPKIEQSGPSGQTYYKQTYSIVMTFGMTTLRAHIAWSSEGVEHRGPVQMVYDDDFVINVSA